MVSKCGFKIGDRVALIKSRSIYYDKRGVITAIDTMINSLISLGVSVKWDGSDAIEWIRLEEIILEKVRVREINLKTLGI